MPIWYREDRERITSYTDMHTYAQHPNDDANVVFTLCACLPKNQFFFLFFGRFGFILIYVCVLILSLSDEIVVVLNIRLCCCCVHSVHVCVRIRPLSKIFAHNTITHRVLNSEFEEKKMRTNKDVNNDDDDVSVCVLCEKKISYKTKSQQNPFTPHLFE